jgi:hypothetical protein
MHTLDSERLIDTFLPHYDFSATYETFIQAPPAMVYRHLQVLDFSELRVFRLLMALRTGKRIQRDRAPMDLRQRIQGTGFIILAEAPEDEVVIGVAGRFWRPDGGRCLDLTAEDFKRFSRSGYAKAGWNFKLSAQTAESTILSTETRIQCFGRGALSKFRLYWSVVAPFSGLIRKAMLQKLKVKTESEAALTLGKPAC